MRSAADMERVAKHNREFVVVRKEGVFAVVKDDVVHRRKVVIAYEEFAAFGWNDRKVMDSVFVPHRQRVLARLQTHRTHAQCSLRFR